MYMHLTYNNCKAYANGVYFFPFDSMYEIRLYYLNIIKK